VKVDCKIRKVVCHGESEKHCNQLEQQKAEENTFSSARTCHRVDIFDFSVKTSHFPTQTNTLTHFTLKVFLGDALIAHSINTAKLEHLKHITSAVLDGKIINRHRRLTVDLREGGQLHGVFP